MSRARRVRWAVRRALRRFPVDVYDAAGWFLPPAWRRCRCRSYHRRTGLHARECPRG